MELAIFDLDNTLLSGDSDHAWTNFLIQRGIVDSNLYEKANEKFLSSYRKGKLNINEYLAFSLQPLSEYPRELLEQWRNDFMTQIIEPMILPKALNLLEKHRRLNHYLLIITATNRFVTELIAQRLGVDDLIAIELEQKNQRFTGKPEGILSFREGKVKRLQSWLSTHPRVELANAFFYSDSINDLPLLSVVDHPVAVDPDEALAEQAKQSAWPIISLRDYCSIK